MHSHERTLLASLAFRDPDKSNPLHDWACQYIAIRENIIKLVKMVYRTENFASDWDAVFEKVISKGEGQYATTIGFIDVSFVFVLEDMDRWEHWGGLCVEVKIEPVPVGDVIRQINLYRQYECSFFKELVNEISDNDRDFKDLTSKSKNWPVKWVLATHFVYDEIDMDALKASGIHPVFLGQSFDDWCEKRRNPNQ